MHADNALLELLTLHKVWIIPMEIVLHAQETQLLQMLVQACACHVHQGQKLQQTKQHAHHARLDIKQILHQLVVPLVNQAHTRLARGCWYAHPVLPVPLLKAQPLQYARGVLLDIINQFPQVPVRANHVSQACIPLGPG